MAAGAGHLSEVKSGLENLDVRDDETFVDVFRCASVCDRIAFGRRVLSWAYSIRLCWVGRMNVSTREGRYGFG